MNRVAAETSLSSHLISQVHVLTLPARDVLLAEAVIESLDDDGYLRLDDLEELVPVIDLPARHPRRTADRAQARQSLEPAGGRTHGGSSACCCTNSTAGVPQGTRAHAHADLGALESLATKDAAALAKLVQRPVEAVAAACARIRRLDPRPGWRFGSADIRYITPDVTVKKVRNVWTVALNPAIVPKVRLHRVYAEMFQRHQQAAHPELASQLREARWTLRNVEQRFATILGVAQAIVKRQHHFFDYGPLAMKPMGLKEIAEEVGVHESTVSRVTNNKYMSTPLGVFELKYFFSRAMTATSGSAFSGTAIRGLIKDMIENEKPGAPLSDAEITRSWRNRASWSRAAPSPSTAICCVSSRWSAGGALHDRHRGVVGAGNGLLAGRREVLRRQALRRRADGVPPAHRCARQGSGHGLAVACTALAQRRLSRPACGAPAHERDGAELPRGGRPRLASNAIPRDRLVGVALVGATAPRVPPADARLSAMPRHATADKTLRVGAPARPPFDIGAGHLPHSPTVLLLVDVINPLESPEASKLAEPALTAARATQRLKQRLARDGVPTIYANDNYGVWRSDFRDILAHCEAQPGTPADLAQLLAPGPEDLVMLKPRHSAFFATPLDLMLTQMHTRNLVIAGLATDICVQLTAMDASLRGYKLWVPADCTAAESEVEKKNSLAYMARVLKADVRRSSTRRALLS